MLQRKSGVYRLRWLRELTMTVTPGLPEQIRGGLVFAGSDAQPPAALGLEGKILVRLGAPVGTPAANRPLPALPEGMLGTLSIDNLDGPERRRWPAAYAVFMQIGVPATGFVFGFEKGSREEATFCDWYSVRHHSPADDLKQPWDPAAAAKFNEFFARLVETIANASERPQWKNTRKLAPRK